MFYCLLIVQLKHNLWLPAVSLCSNLPCLYRFTPMVQHPRLLLASCACSSCPPHCSLVSGLFKLSWSTTQPLRPGKGFYTYYWSKVCPSISIYTVPHALLTRMSSGVVYFLSVLSLFPIKTLSTLIFHSTVTCLTIAAFVVALVSFPLI